MSNLSQSVACSGTVEREYLLKRADDHRQLAEKTQENGSRNIHLRLEQLYREQAQLIALVFPD